MPSRAHVVSTLTTHRLVVGLDRVSTALAVPTTNAVVAAATVRRGEETARLAP